MAVIIKNGKTYGDRSVSLTQAEYNALSETEKNNGTVYYIYDVNAVPQASDVVYDNTESGLNASNVQGAIDELNNALTDYTSYHGTNTSRSISAGGFVTLNSYTIPKDGLYYARFSQYCNKGDMRYAAYLYKNGSAIRTSVIFHNGSAACDAVIYLESGDVIEGVFSTGSAVSDLNTDGTISYLEVVFIK